ncbi:zinc finger X-chromosomal protein-like [Saccoglossus kowalevskii]|uniref:Zinc finger protein 43-like n=1 Tax=Saccoglossus kowalevskii TaxID=10224 RepID=A0ABM0LV22_SACKO|nr:PREDICTED: zinc finger protein 43-like [Saccoglossus kowalevskii]
MEPFSSCDEPDFLTEKRALFQKALDLTSKFRANVFIIVAENGKASEYWGSVDFVKEYHTTGLKVRSHDVGIFPAMSSDIYLDSNPVLHPTMIPESKTELYPTEISEHQQGMETADVKKQKFNFHGNESQGIGSSLVVVKCENDPNKFSLEEEDYSNNMNEEGHYVVMETKESEIEGINRNDGIEELHVEEMFEINDSVAMENEKLNASNVDGLDAINCDSNNCDRQTKAKRVKFQKFTVEEKILRLSRLYRESHSSKEFVCDRCGVWFATLAAWKIHESEDTCSKRKCRYCGVGPLMHQELQEHKLQNHARKIPLRVCTICDKDFLYFNTLQTHLLKEHGIEQKRKYRCEECEKNFHSGSDLNKHKLLHGERKYTCSICDKKLVTAKLLAKHEETHGKIYKCELCDGHFASAINLKQHIKGQHTKEGLLSCPICQKSSVSSYQLSYHMASAHDQFDELVHCKYCNKAFKHQVNLKLHVKSQHILPSFLCEICGKQFRGARQLQLHRAVHTEKREQCPICFKYFTARKHMKRHIVVVHSDEKPWQCDECDYSCKLGDSLQQHKKIHIKNNVPVQYTDTLQSAIL